MNKAATYLILYLLSTNYLLAQEKESSTKELKAMGGISNVVKTNPFALAIGDIFFTSEIRVVNEFVNGTHQSSQIGLSYLTKGPILMILENANGNGDEKLTVSGFRIQVAHKFYFSEHLATNFQVAPRGIYLSPHISYSTARVSTKNLNQYDRFIQATQFNMNMLIGYQIIANGDFAFDFFAGLGFKENRWFEHESARHVTRIDPFTDFPLYSSPLKITLGFNTGFAF